MGAGGIEITVGETYTVQCPFVRKPYQDYDEDGPFTTLSWKPGVTWQQCGPEDVEARAHGMGSVSYTVISIHALPHPYPKRVFFTRKWTAPDGRSFGKNRLHIMTADQFARRLKSYVPAGFNDYYHELVVADMTSEERQRALA